MIIPKELTILKHKIKVIYVRTLESKAQGFYTSKGRFVSRQEAYEIAKRAGQLTDNKKLIPGLTSEDLY